MFARENFLGIKTMQTIAQLKRQLFELLSAAGFVKQRPARARSRRRAAAPAVATAFLPCSTTAGATCPKTTGIARRAARRSSRQEVVLPAGCPRTPTSAGSTPPTEARTRSRVCRRVWRHRRVDGGGTDVLDRRRAGAARAGERTAAEGAAVRGALPAGGARRDARAQKGRQEQGRRRRRRLDQIQDPRGDRREGGAGGGGPPPVVGQRADDDVRVQAPIYAEKVKTTQIYVRLRARLSVCDHDLRRRAEGRARRAGGGSSDDAVLVVDARIRFRLPFRVATLVLGVRAQLAAVLRRRLSDRRSSSRWRAGDFGRRHGAPRAVRLREFS